YTGGMQSRGFTLRNVLIADDVDYGGEDLFDEGDGQAPTLPGSQSAPAGGAGPESDTLWIPQNQGTAGKWKSTVRLSQKFFNECVSKPVPIDLRAY
ncbi:hypothetical protein ACV36C_40400, partial [Pseudomonas aeruginosa]